MSDLTPQMPSFCEELSKEAAPVGQIARQALQRGLGGLGAGTGVGLGAGALGGAALGAYKGYRESREGGGSKLQAGISGLARGIGGVGKGALVGAAAGGAGLGALRAAGRLPGADKLIQKGGPVGALSRFGQRQVHSLTGWKPEGGIRALKGGAYDAKKALEGVTDPKKLQRAKRRAELAEKTEALGMTSLPGYAKALAGKATLDGRRVGGLEALKTGLGEQWHGGGAMGKAMMIGFPAMETAKAIKGPEYEGDMSRGERIGRAIGGGLGFGLAPIPVLGQGLLAAGTGAAGGRIGRLVGGGRKPPPPETEPSGGEVAPRETIMSDRATGQYPEGLVGG